MFSEKHEYARVGSGANYSFPPGPLKKKGDHHRHRGRNNRARLRDKNGNGRENVAACTWKDVALRRRLTRSPAETRSAKSDGNMNEGMEKRG